MTPVGTNKVEDREGIAKYIIASDIKVAARAWPGGTPQVGPLRHFRTGSRYQRVVTLLLALRLINCLNSDLTANSETADKLRGGHDLLARSSLLSWINQK